MLRLTTEYNVPAIVCCLARQERWKGRREGGTLGETASLCEPGGAVFDDIFSNTYKLQGPTYLQTIHIEKAYELDVLNYLQMFVSTVFSKLYLKMFCELEL